MKLWGSTKKGNLLINCNLLANQ